MFVSLIIFPWLNFPRNLSIQKEKIAPASPASWMWLIIAKWLGTRQFSNLVKINKTIIKELSVGDEKKYNFINNYVSVQGGKCVYWTVTYKFLTVFQDFLNPDK